MSERRHLSDGSSFPAIGFGTNQIDVGAIASAIDLGYRMLDTAWVYGNESDVGTAIRGSGMPRDEFTVITKLPGRAHGVDEVRVSLAESLTSLGLDYVDLYLIHWPMPRIGRYVEAWEGLIALREEGLVRSIGVSNFNPDHVLRLIEETGVAPVVDQVEMHPHFIQADQRAFASERSIRTMSWSPLGRRADLMADATVADIVRRHGASPAQVVVRWHIELGSVPIPRSTSTERQAENLDVFAFSLDVEEVAAISRLDSGVRLWGADPETKEEF